MISLTFTEVISRLTENGIRCYPTMNNGVWSQIVAQDSPDMPESTWFIIKNERVEVEDDFRELYPL